MIKEQYKFIYRRTLINSTPDNTTLPRPRAVSSPSYPDRGGRDRVPASRGPRINDAIRALEVRLVGLEGEMLGVVSRADALNIARDAGVDLVEVAPDSSPPVCKVLDYGKYRYQEQKRLAAARKKQKIIEVKEIKMRPVTDENDFQVKLRAIHRFIDEGNKVKVLIRFRGREVSHQQLGRKLMDRIKEDFGEDCKIEQEPRFEGYHMIMMVAPK